MRVPVDVLERVRGAMVVAALAACTSEPAAPPPAPPPVSVAAPAPIDPVSYDAANESARLARLDLEEQSALESRSARVAHVQAERRVAELGGIGGIGRLRPQGC